MLDDRKGWVGEWVGGWVGGLSTCWESLRRRSAYCQQDLLGCAFEWKKQNFVLQSGQLEREGTWVGGWVNG